MRSTAFLLLVAMALVCLSSPSAGAPSTSTGVIRRLRELQTIYRSGFLTQREYLQKKDLLINQALKIAAPPSPKNDSFSLNVQFLLNAMNMGLPRSYVDVLPNGHLFWKTPAYLTVGAFAPSGKQVTLDSAIATQERTLTHYGLNLYDGATWEIAMALSGLEAVSDIYERNVLYTSSTGSNPQVGGLIDVRSDTDDYAYGVDGTLGSALDEITLPGNATRIPSENGQPASSAVHTQPGALFYRMIGPGYQMTDPLDGNYANSWKYPFPNNDSTTPWNIAGEIHWNDWKPILGESVWGAIIGPLQSLYIRTNGNITKFTTFDDAPSQVQLALSILPGVKALQSPLGAIYHCPKGCQMFPHDPSEETNVSNENNFSAYAALTMLYQVLTNSTSGTSDPVLTDAISDLEDLLKGLQKWFASSSLFNADPQVVYQGGHVSFSGDFEPATLNETGGFAVDCQTWGMSVLGADFVDSTFGSKTAFNVWQTTKKLAGYYTSDGNLGGVGYTEPTNGTNTIWSAEWTWGAINMCEKLAYDYKKSGDSSSADSLLADAKSMITEIKKQAVRCDDDRWCGGGLQQEDGSYVYANDRFFIPWGWYANPIASTCSTAWAVMHEHSFNPFILGGGLDTPVLNL